MQLWSTLPMCQVTQVYRTGPPDRPDDGNRDHDRPRRRSAIVAAYHASIAGAAGPFLMGWLRPDASGPVTVFVTATPAAGPADHAGTSVLSYPPGSRGRRCSPDDVLGGLRLLPAWTGLDGVVDSLVVDPATPGGQPPDVGPDLADILLGAWHGPFAWLLVAEPLPPADVAAEAMTVAGQERQARSVTSSPELAVRADRLRDRHRELRLAETTGLWRVRVFAGGADASSAQAVAGLLCAATDLSGLPYSLRPSTRGGALAALAAAGEPATVAGSRLVAALARPPSVEIPGVRVVPRQPFDVTPEVGSPGSGLDAGAVLDRDGRPAARLHLPPESLNRHVFVCGATGSGKSNTIRHLLAQAGAAGLPWLVIEPAKAEYGRLTGSPALVLRLGDPSAPPVGFNPLEPVEGFPLQTHLDLTRALFVASFADQEPFPQVLSAALRRCYETLGWSLPLGEPAHPGLTPRYPTLSDLRSAADDVVDEIGYGPEVTANVRGFMRVRLDSLCHGTPGQFLLGGHRLDLDELMHRNVVLELEDVGDDADKAFLIGAMLIRLTEHLRRRHGQDPHGAGLRHVTVVEEAHRLLRKPEGRGPAAHAVELFAAMLAEVRAYGEGLIVADQIPSKLVPDVIKNTAVKIVHRLPARDDRDDVGATMNLSDEQSRFLVTVPPGTGAFFVDGMDRPVLVEVPEHTAPRPVPAATSLVVLIERPAPACPPRCEDEPCTARRMALAVRHLTADPRLVLWAELSVVGHVLGLPAPAPDGAVRTAVLGVEPGLLDCVLRHAVERAVDHRSAALATSHSPAEFSAHVVGDLRERLLDGAGCGDPLDRWAVPTFMWNMVRVALKSLLDTDPAAGRHPDSDAWARRYGRVIPGATAQAQDAAVRQWALDALPRGPAYEALVFGSAVPSAVETAVGSSRTAPGWRDALRRATAELGLRADWPGLYVRSAPRDEVST